MTKPIICPTITATTKTEYRNQITQIKSFATRVHIDLMDGKFVETKSTKLKDLWWYDFMKVDLHLMYKDPSPSIKQLKRLSPSLVIIHAEADVNLSNFALKLRDLGIKAGLALLQQTTVNQVKDHLKYFDHILVFSGHLGYHGGKADMSMVHKLQVLKEMFPNKEIGWDGGINDDNVGRLIENGASVLNVGGFIQDSPDPSASYAKLKEAVNKIKNDKTLA